MARTVGVRSTVVFASPRRLHSETQEGPYQDLPG